MASSNVDLVISSDSPFGMNSKSTTWLVDCSVCPVLWFSMEQDDDGAVGDFANLEWPCESGNERVFCYLMYTSGSTGKPKGVCGTEQGRQVLFGIDFYIQDDFVLYFQFKCSFGIRFVSHSSAFEINK